MSAPAAPVAAEPAPAGAPVVLDDAQFGNVDGWWPKVAQRVAQVAAHRPVLQQLTPEGATTERLTLRPASAMPVSPKLREALSTAAFEVTGRKLVVEVLDPRAVAVATAAPVAEPTAMTEPAVSAPSPSPAPARAASRSAAPSVGVVQDEGVMNLMSMFDATPVSPDDDTSAE